MTKKLQIEKGEDPYQDLKMEIFRRTNSKYKPMLKKLTPQSSYLNNKSTSKTMCDILYKLREVACGKKKPTSKKVRKKESGSVLYSQILDSQSDPSFEYSNLYMKREAHFGKLKMPKCNFKIQNSADSTVILDSDRLSDHFKTSTDTD